MFSMLERIIIVIIMYTGFLVMAWVIVAGLVHGAMLALPLLSIVVLYHLFKGLVDCL